MHKLSTRAALPLALLASLVAASVALGDDTPPRIATGDVRSVTEDIRALNGDGPRATAAEYDKMRSVAMAPRRDEANAAPTASQLLGENGGRVIGDHPDVGRIVAVASKDSSGFCANIDLPESTGLESPSFCNGRLEAHGLAVSNAWTPQGRTLFGIVADDVSSVIVERASGEREPARIDGNAFLWHGDTDDQPVTITSHRGGDQHRIELADPRTA